MFSDLLSGFDIGIFVRCWVNWPDKSKLSKRCGTVRLIGASDDANPKRQELFQYRASTRRVLDNSCLVGLAPLLAPRTPVNLIILLFHTSVLYKEYYDVLPTTTTAR